MTDSELLAFVKFCFDRFSGYVPEEKMLVNCLADFRKSEVATASGNPADTLSELQCLYCNKPTIKYVSRARWVCDTCGADNSLYYVLVAEAIRYEQGSDLPSKAEKPSKGHREAQ